MKINNKEKKIIPTVGNLIVGIDTDRIREDVEAGKFFVPVDQLELGNKDGVRMYHAEVLSINEDEKTPLQVGDYVIFNSFAGTHLATDELIKVIPIEQALVSMKKKDVKKDSEKLFSNLDTMHPNMDRIIIEIINPKADDQLFDAKSETQDPRIADMKYGKVLKLGPDCKGQIKIDDIVAIEAFVGETIRSESLDKPELVALSEAYVTAIIRD